MMRVWQLHGRGREKVVTTTGVNLVLSCMVLSLGRNQSSTTQTHQHQVTIRMNFDHLGVNKTLS
jgi:hypothetical protein